jgi:recombinational DNA repair protein (RecF pathway)
MAMRLLALLGFALTLGACTKCDVPTWQRSSSGDAPAACHDSPAPQ